MPRANDAKVTSIKCQHLWFAVPLRDGDQRGIDKPKRQIPVAFDQLRGSSIIVEDQVDDLNPLVSHIIEEGQERCWTESSAGQPVKFNNDRGWHNQSFVSGL